MPLTVSSYVLKHFNVCYLNVQLQCMCHQEKASQEKKIPGFVFGVSNSDEEIYFKGTGYRVVNDPNSGEVVPDSVFWVCSQAKLIVHVSTCTPNYCYV